MNDATETDRQNCPSWCSGEHNLSPFGIPGYYHDGARAALTPAFAGEGGVHEVAIRLSQFVQPEAGAGAPYVEVRHAQDDDATGSPIATSVTLAPGEARQYAHLLLMAAATADVVPADPAAQPRSSWQTEPCPSWCTWQPHGENELPTDRHHTNETRQHPLSLEPAVEVDGGAYEPEYIAVYLWQHDREREPLVHVNKGDNPESFRLTLDEAEATARMLLEVIAQARA